MTNWALGTAKPVGKDLAVKDYRVGRVSTVLMRLVDLGIPAPDQVVYRPYAQSFVRGDLSRVGDGVVSVDWVWDVLDIREINTLVDIFFGRVTATTYATTYIRTDIRTGDYGDPHKSFANYSCIVWRPQVFGPEGTPVAKTPYAYSAVGFKFINLVVLP